MRSSKWLFLAFGLVLGALWLPHAAFAQCTPDPSGGAPVTCDGTDGDGFTSGGTEIVTVNAGAQVDEDSGTNDGIQVGAGSFVVNNGNIGSTGTPIGDDGVQADGGSIVANASSGQINASYGIYLSGGGVAINDGFIQADDDGLLTDSAAVLINNGTLTGADSSSDGLIFGSDEADVIINNGTINSPSGIAISGNGGDDVIIIQAGSTVIGIIDGGEVNLDDGCGGCESGPDLDILTLTGNTYDSVGWAAFQACVANPDGCDDDNVEYTLTLDGKSYTFSNFEDFINALVLLAGGGGGGGDFSVSITTGGGGCDSGVVKVFHTADGFVQVYSGFWLFPADGFLVGVFHESDAQIGDVFSVNDPNYPHWSVEIAGLGDGGLIVRDEHGNIVSRDCGL